MTLYQISGCQGCQESDGERDASDGDEHVRHVVLDHVEGVLEHALPRRICQPTFGNVTQTVTHIELHLSRVTLYFSYWIIEENLKLIWKALFAFFLSDMTISWWRDIVAYRKFSHRWTNFFFNYILNFLNHPAWSQVQQIHLYSFCYSPPRKSLVKGERFIRFEEEQERTDLFPRQDLLFITKFFQ